MIMKNGILDSSLGTKEDLLEGPERVRRELNEESNRAARSAIGQFLTPRAIAQFMASRFQRKFNRVRILDAGAGAGALFAATVQALCSRDERPQSIEVVAYETDERMLRYLKDTMAACGAECERRGVMFTGSVREVDFITGSLGQQGNGLFCGEEERFTHAILNPPYKKIGSQTETRRRLDAFGMGTSNLYAAFVWLAAKSLEPGGELVSITPRSFCNGPYFRRYRKAFLALMSLRHIHVFKSRRKAFEEDSVLQENVIVHAVRETGRGHQVELSSSEGADFENVSKRKVALGRVVRPGDPDAFIHLPLDDGDEGALGRMGRFKTTLAELGLEVSTGRVVDFRAKEHLRFAEEPGTVPLIYAANFENGLVRWPRGNRKKPCCMEVSEKTAGLTVPSGHYVLTKRFTTKEERRRVVAAVYDPEVVRAESVGFENHLNYFHAKGKGMASNLAKGLAVFLNSSLCDRYFRVFSGHTQVNAMDLRKMRYPTCEELIHLGKRVGARFPGQEEVDAIFEEECGGDE